MGIESEGRLVLHPRPDLPEDMHIVGDGVDIQIDVLQDGLQRLLKSD